MATTQLASASIENGRVEWKKWVTEKNQTIQTSPTSFLNLNDAVYLEKGDRVYLPTATSPNTLKWQKGAAKAAWVSVEYDGTSAWAQGIASQKLDLVVEKKRSLDNGLWIVAERLSDGALRLRLHNPQNPDLRKFSGLEFFPYNEEALVDAELVLAKEFTPYDFITVRNRTSKSWIIGVVRFHLMGQVEELTVYSDTRDDIRSLFIPFKDRTNSDTTFGGGRYLDVVLAKPLDLKLRSREISLNFNYAYHPLCVRSSFFNCVRIPGKVMKFALNAGERLPQETKN